MFTRILQQQDTSNLINTSHTSHLNDHQIEINIVKKKENVHMHTITHMFI